MSNLLDKASIILTPTAYNNGEALCVKPSDGSGDFQFSRNSAATRVNAQGLVENVQILSSNLVQNGDFSEEGVQEVSNGSFSQEGSELVVGGNFSNPSDWNLSGQNLSISNGKGISTGSNFGAQFKQTILTINKTYKLVFDIVDYTSGAIGLTANYYGVQQTFNSVGTHTAYFTSLNQTELRLYSENFIGSIDNVSVREVGQDWTLGAGWSIGEDKAVANTTGNFVNLYQNSVFVVGKTYKTTFTIVDYTQGKVRLTQGGIDVSGYQNAVGTYTTYFTASQTALYMQGSESFIGSITNISVKEVGQNWVLNAGWEIGNNVVTTDGTINSNIYQNAVTTIGQTYTYSFDVLDSGVGVIDGRFRNGGGFIKNFSSEGTYTGTFVAYNTLADFTTLSGNTASFSITNISVIEITDDTNLPRINYEGFSYQDALGSEEIVNGDFATDANWAKNGTVTISGGTANFNNSASGNNVQQTVTLPSGKQYIATYEITSITEGKFSIYVGGVLSGNQNNQVGVYTEVFTSIGVNAVYVRARGTTTGSIDNVSVKEYLGQEVIPNSGCGSWLWEPQSTNLVTQSELLNGYWSNSGSTNLISDVISPDGISFSKKVTTTSAGNYKGLLKNESVIWDSKTFTISTFAKRGNTDWLYFYNIGSNNGNNGVWFNLDTGLIGSIGAAWSNVKIETFTNGWYRCSATLSFGAATNYLYILNSDVNNSVFSTLDNYAYIWGTQIEENNISSYIPTSGSTVTRNQDVCNNGATGAGLINSTEGVLYAEMAYLNDTGTFRTISINDGTNNNQVAIENRPTSNQVKAYVLVNGVFSMSSIQTLTNVKNFNKIAILWKQNDFAFWVNGTKVYEDLSGLTFGNGVLNKVNFNNGIENFPFEGKTKALAIFKEALTDQELTELTTI